jgi:predicted ATPase/DNA-binding SARP family transcriptional activator
MPLLTIELLGSPRISLAGGPLDVRVRKELALLAYLAVEREHHHSRESILGLLWPDASDEAARNNLRVVLAGLRRLLGAAGDAFLHTERQYMQFLPGSDHTLDVIAFRRQLADTHAHAHATLEQCDACLTRLAEAVALYRGDFLVGFSLPDSAAFEEWATIQREQLHQQQLDALDTLTIAHELRGDYVAQCRFARRQLVLEPWRETAYAQLMRGLWAIGQRGAALEQYEACRRILEAELGLEPSPELTALYNQLSGAAAPQAVAVGEGRMVRQAAPAVVPAQHDLPPLHNLPPQTTSFIGREEQLADLRQALDHTRLITLTGAGGCGKTRLALELAAARLSTYPDGVWFVALGPLRDPALVTQAMAEALGLQTASEQSASQLLGAALRPKQLLLVLDNCEHLVAACHQLAEQLLHDCPQLTILATSREMLRVAGEVVWQVPSLSAPDDASATPKRLLSYESIRLFVERASTASVGFALTARNAPAVVAICRQLDSLPLALELAAARVRHMDVATIAARLDDRFSLLAGGGSLAPRQQRLRAALDWSYSLLDEPERVCFRRLAVFAAGFTLEAAEEVACDPSEQPDGAASTVELLAQLIDKSLLVAEQRPEGMRYRLLETMRAYARDQLLRSGESEAVGARHAAHFLRLAEQAEVQLVGDDQIAWLDWLAAEHANLRAAVDWATERSGVIAALRLVTALRYFWRVRGYYAEGIELLRGLLAHPTVAGGTRVRARALNAAGYLEFVRGQQARAGELLEEALSIGRALGEAPVVAFALRYLCALANARHAYADARAYGEESLAIYRSLGATNDIAGSSMYLGDIALAQGDDDRAEALYAESAAILRLRRNSISLPYPLRHLGYLALRRGQPERAAALCAESLQLNLAVSDQQGVAACLVGLAASAAALERFEQAARLLGQAEARLEALHSRLLPFDRMEHDRVQHIVSERLNEAVLAAASAAGRAMAIEQLLAEVVPDQAAEPGAAKPPADLPTPTIGRERELSIPTGQQRAVEVGPPARPAPLHNLPSPLSSFFGRADELSRLAALLASDTRLVTLVGSGGAGKTRLALAIAWQLLPLFPEGAWWVALAGVQPADDPALGYGTLASAVATALGRALSGRRDPLDELADTLQDRTLLLVLDNCEHLPEVAIVARTLLEAAPKVRVVATSREPLGLSGEALVRLEGLPVPPPGANDPASYPGVQLFVERASRHAPGWGEATTGDAVARLCRLLDGLPLAIELAAHWVGHYTPDEIVEAIQADLDFLAARTRDIPDRHRSLRAVFDYAWRSLNAAEQQALMQASVFRGSFDRAAAQAVANVRATTLVALADKSLLQQLAIGRYMVHELLRQFAAERLGDSGELAAVRAQHAAYYLALAEQVAPELTRPDQAATLERVDIALDNLRAALSWMDEQGQLELGLRLAGALERFWFTRGYLSEGREWLERFLTPAASAEVSPAVRAQAFSAAGLLANTQGDHIQAVRWLELGLESYRAADDLAGAVRALTTLGGVAYDQGDLREARERWQQSLAQARAVGDPGEIVRALGNLGEAHYHLGELERAAALHVEALALAQQLGRANLVAFQLGDLGNVARRQGDLERATALHRQALELKRALGARRQIAITLEDLAAVAAAEGNATRAARLLGAAAAIRAEIGTPQAIPERNATEQAVAEVRAALGEQAWSAAFSDGLLLSVNQAIAYALE